MRLFLIATTFAFVASSAARVEAAGPTKSTQVRQILKSALGQLQVHRGWQPHPEFQPRLQQYGQAVLGLKRWNVTQLERQGRQLVFDAYKITDRSGGFTHGYRVKGSISAGEANLDIWTLADGFRSGGAKIARRGQQTRLEAGRASCEVWTAKPMTLDKALAKGLK